MRVYVLTAASMVMAHAAQAGAPLPPVPLRVMTLNVFQGIGPPGSMPAVATGRFITRQDLDGAGPNIGLQPDVVCFQECSISAFFDLPNFINTYLSYPVAGVPTPYTFWSADGDGFNFNTILVRPDITVLDADNVNNAGPRNWARVTLQVPGALRTLTVYSVHFKAFSDATSMNQRRLEANELGQAVYNDLTLGLDLDDNGSRETPPGDLFIAGDLNSPDNSDGTITGVFTHSIFMVPTGLTDLPVERLSGRIPTGLPQTATFPSFGSRLDYIAISSSLAAPFDANQNGMFPRATFDSENDQAEINSAGFVYYSGDSVVGHAPGQFANGDANATTTASDHRPVIFDLRLVRNPALPYFPPGDLDQDTDRDVEDLYRWEAAFASGTAPDIDGNRNIDPADRSSLRSTVRAGEPDSVGL